MNTAQDGALAMQVGGGHYKDLKIQPIEYIHGNKLPFIEGAVVKYVTRWRTKGGLEDLRKARHLLDLLLELEQKVPPVEENPWRAHYCDVPPVAGDTVVEVKIEGKYTKDKRMAKCYFWHRGAGITHWRYA